MDHDQKLLSRLVEVTLVGGQKIHAHPEAQCANDPQCAIHRPSDHHMVTWPQRWRPHIRLMQRECPHGIAHPDPDHMAHILTRPGPVLERQSGDHTCDGCCQDNSPPTGNPFTPNWSVHPGTTLAEWIDENYTSVIAVARATGIDIKRLSPFIAGTSSVSVEMAQQLAAHTAIPAHLWISLQAQYDKQAASAIPREAWHPGDPVYPAEPVSSRCSACGTTWTPAADVPCPECDTPLTRRQVTELICRHAVGVHRLLNELPDTPESLADRQRYRGQINGLNIALCSVRGWSPTEPEAVAAAADLILRWWEQHHPEDCPSSPPPPQPTAG